MTSESLNHVSTVDICLCAYLWLFPRYSHGPAKGGKMKTMPIHHSLLVSHQPTKLFANDGRLGINTLLTFDGGQPKGGRGARVFPGAILSIWSLKI